MNRMLFQLSNLSSCPRISQDYGKNTLSYYRRPGNRLLSSSSKWLCFLLIHPSQTAGNSAGVVRDALLFDRLHFSIFLLFQRHLKLSSKIRSSLLYFSTAITFERFKTFCLHFSRAETETFTRERDLIPIGILSNRSLKENIDSDKVFPTAVPFNRSLQLIIKISKIYNYTLHKKYKRYSWSIFLQSFVIDSRFCTSNSNRL